MGVLKVFLLGFIFVYIINVLDLFVQLLSSYISIWITKCNVKISELSREENKQDDPYRIGFQIQDEEYYDEDEYEEEYKIGFKNKI